MKKKVMAVVPAAGIGKRLGAPTNKPFACIKSKPLIVWTLETLERMPEIHEIIPVVKKADIPHATDLFKRHNITKVRKIASGGKERQDSVYEGLRLIDDHACLVLIHDGARPLIEAQVVRRALKACENSDGVVVGIPVKDTIKKANGDVITETLDRNNLWAIQTPQIFRFETLCRAYEKALKDDFYATDDAALVEQYGGTVRIIRGSYANIKVTVPEDITMAELLLRKRNDHR